MSLSREEILERLREMREHYEGNAAQNSRIDSSYNRGVEDCACRVEVELADLLRDSDAPPREDAP